MMGAWLWTLPGLALFGVDGAFYLHERYCRFHIGRWDSREAWAEAVGKCALRWLRRTPTVKITDNSRYVLLDMLQGKYRSHTIQSWQKAALMLGLLERNGPGDAEAARSAARELLREDGSWKRPPVAVDCGMLSYAVLKALGPEAVRPAMDQSLRVIDSFRHKSGMLSYTGSGSNPEMYVDTLGLACPFLALYAREYGAQQWEELAVFQLQTYHDRGMYGDTGLPNHAFHVETGLPCGVYGWGRGTGWYLIGLMDTYRELTTPRYRDLVADYIGEAARKLRQFQRSDGGFGATLQRMQTYDSSATAVLAWFYGCCTVVLEEEVLWQVRDGALDALRKRTRITGSIDWCQGDTKDLGVFAQTYDIMPFAQGMALRALAAEKECP